MTLEKFSTNFNQKFPSWIIHDTNKFGNFLKKKKKGLMEMEIKVYKVKVCTAV